MTTVGADTRDFVDEEGNLRGLSLKRRPFNKLYLPHHGSKKDGPELMMSEGRTKPRLPCGDIATYETYEKAPHTVSGTFKTQYNNARLETGSLKLILSVTLPNHLFIMSRARCKENNRLLMLLEDPDSILISKFKSDLEQGEPHTADDLSESPNGQMVKPVIIVAS